MELRVAIVADDLTGAGDSVVPFADNGWSARLALAGSPPAPIAPRSAVAMTADSRALPADEASRATSDAVRSLIRSGAERLFLKIDSTMRGSVSAQIAGALDAWSAVNPAAFPVVCPAYPAMGRTVEAGRLLVDGVPAERTAVGIDPVTPLTSGRLAVLLPGSVRVVLTDDAATANAARLAAAGKGGGVVVVDAAEQADLTRLAAAMELLGSQVIPAGAGGLAVACSDRWAAPGVAGRARRAFAPRDRIVVVVSSLHDVSRSQFAHLVASFAAEDLFVITPTPGSAAPAAMDRWLAGEFPTHGPLPRVIVVSSPPERASPASPQGDASARAVAGELAATVEKVFDRAPIDALILIGGEGARAVLDRLGADTILVTHAIREGIPVGIIEGGRADGLVVATKAGGFGVAEHVTEVLRELLTGGTSDRPAPPRDLTLLQPPQQGESL